MRFASHPPLLALVCALACVSRAPIEQSTWIRVDTEHFRLVSGADPDVTLEIADRLELLHAVLEFVGLQATLEPRVPLLVYVFGRSTDFARFRPKPGVAGFMLPRPQRYFLVVDASDERRAGNVALHEYVHFVLRNGPNHPYPPWYDEGLAEFLSTVAADGDQVVVARIPPDKKDWLLFGSPLSLRQVMTADDAFDWSEQARARFYAQAWAIAHFLHAADRAGFPSRRDQALRYIGLLGRGLDPDAACIEAFGTDFEGLELEFLQYLGEGQLPNLGVSRAKLHVSAAREQSILAESEKRSLLGELALALGEDWSEEAAYWFRMASRAEPSDAVAHAGLGRALAVADPVDSDAELALAHQLGGADPRIDCLLGEAWLERATASGGADRAELVAHSRRAFRRSIERNPEQVAAYAGLGRSYLVSADTGDATEGVAALRSAHERLPADRTVTLWLARLETASGQPERARQLLARSPPPSHGDPLAASERSALEAVRVAAGLPARPPRTARHLEVRLDVEAPQPEERVRGLSGWVPVAGRGGLWEAAQHDVVIAIDESLSTLLPTGSDVDGDGHVGAGAIVRSLGPAGGSTDPDDTVIRAELAAAAALIRQLDPRSTRVGIVTFSGRSRALATLGRPEVALWKLEAYEVSASPTGTSLAAALRGALDMLFEFREVGERRQRTILLLSDGHPTVPSAFEGKREALEIADRLGEIGVAVQAFALGRTALEEPDFYRSLAERSGGRFIPVEDPAAVVSELANIRFTGLRDVQIRSEPAGRPGRAVRVFSNGTFDGYASLREGRNLVSVTATMEGGAQLTETRSVFFERPAQPDPADLRRDAELQRALANRAIELELLAEIRRGTAPRARELELEVEPVREAPAPSPDS